MASLVDIHAGWLRRVVVAAVPLLLVAGGVGAALVSGDGGVRDETSVAALASPTAGDPAAEAAGAAQLPGTTVARPPAEVTTTTRPSPTTTAARAAAFEAPPITSAVPESTRPTTPTTAAVPVTTATTVPRSTTTTIPTDVALVTFVNEFPEAVIVLVNGITLDLDPGERMVDFRIIPAASNNDAIGVTWKAVPTCGIGDAMKYFAVGQRFTFTVITGTGRCGVNNQFGPDFRVTPSLVP